MPKLTCNCGYSIFLTDKARQSMTEMTCPQCGETRKLRPVDPGIAADEKQNRKSFASVVAVPCAIALISVFISQIKETSVGLAVFQTVASFCVLAPVPLIFAYRIWLGADGRYAMSFRHPVNGFVVEIRDPFPGSLFFGPFYAAYHEAWQFVVLGVLLVIVGFGFPWLILPWFSPHMMRRWYLSRGYTQISGQDL